MQIQYRLIVIFILILGFPTKSLNVQALKQSGNATPSCAISELDQVAFLEGEWNVKSEKRKGLDGEEWISSEGTAAWKRTLSGCVYREQWSGMVDGKSLQWLQVLGYNQREATWELGMVDTAHGNLIVSEGYYSDNALIFTTPHMSSGQLLIDKIVIRNVDKNRLAWTLHTSPDGGETWTKLWKMQYSRKDEDS